MLEGTYEYERLINFRFACLKNNYPVISLQNMITKADKILYI